MNILTADEIRRVEVKENEIGTRFLKLMELAGGACARRIMDEFYPEDGSVAVLCGSGKNGGDGFVIARKLYENGYNTACIMAFGMPKAEDAVTNDERALEIGVPVIDFGKERAFSVQTIASAGCIVDAMFGIGFHGAASEEQAEVFDLASRSNGFVAAIDVPSGVETDTGTVRGDAVQADLTLAISCLKPAHVLFPAREFCGNTEVLDIGISDESFSAAEPSLITYDDDDIAHILPERTRTSHKNDNGHLLVAAGSRRMPGAACMCAAAALRSGAGLVTAAFPESAYPALASHAAEAMLLPCPETRDGWLSESAWDNILTLLPKASAVVIGCGIGTDPDTAAVLERVLRGSVCPVLLDADALNILASDPGLLRRAQAPVIITPHPGEMSRLTGRSVSDIQANRLETVRSFADEYGVTVLLKGPDTLVASPGKREVCVNCTGNQGLAKGGSGDTLSGIIGSLLAQGLEPFEAASVGAYIHGKAADAVYPLKGFRGMCASDIAEALPTVLIKYE